ncbi:MAG TPA: nidogen-like domain-containing protein, partial [Acidimicrobiia bacterium]
MRARTVVSVAAVAVLGSAGLVAATSSTAGALGPNAIRAGFNTSTFGGNDDDSTTVSLPFPVHFFSGTFNQLFLNNNGNVTFDAALPAYTPFDLSTANRVIIAPFLADVDTRTGNAVTYGTGTVDGHSAWGVNWPGVGCYNLNTSVLNNFQMILVDRSDVAAGDFDIEFNYDRIQWDSGQASDGDANCLNGSSARAGYSDGTAANTFELPGSAVDGAFLDSNSTSGL